MAAGKDIAISELAELVCDVVGYEGTIEYDRTKPDGTPRKLLGEALSLLPPDKVLGLIFNYDGHSPDRHRAYYGLESPEPPPPARGWGALARAVTGLVGGPGSWR